MIKNVKNYNNAVIKGYHYHCPKCGKLFFVNVLPLIDKYHCHCGLLFPRILYNEKRKFLRR